MYKNVLKINFLSLSIQDKSFDLVEKAAYATTAASKEASNSELTHGPV